MYRHVKQNLTGFSTVVLALFMFACGGPKTGSSNSEDEKDKSKDSAEQEKLECGEAVASESDSFRVVSGDGLGQHFSTVFGPSSVLDVKASGENLIERYQTQLGSASTKKIGNLTADEVGPGNPLTSYFAVLGIVAANAGLYCTTADDERCKCEDADSASAMLNRAIAFKSFCPDEELVKDFVDLCKKNKSDAIVALASSLAFVKK